MPNHSPRLTRRTTLAALGSGLAMASLGGPLAQGQAASLAALAAARGLRFGSATAAFGAEGGSVANPRYAALLAREAALLVPENEMKWQWLRPAPNRFDFAGADAIVGWAKAHGLAVRGHNLLWHRDKWQPRWLADYDFGAAPATGAEKLLTQHITTVVERYRDTVTSFDVVNEAVTPETGGLETTAWSRAMGSVEAVLDLAFHTARATAPQAELVYNDYMGWEDAHSPHRDGVLRLLEGFRKRRVPVDTLGLQSHLVVDRRDPPAERAWRAFLDAVTGMGYGLAITEFDVRGPALPAAIPARDAAVAALAKGYFDLTLSYRQVHDVLVWGMSNRYSWLRSFEPRPDGQETRGCPYDDDLAPTPLRAALAVALTAAPTRS